MSDAPMLYVARSRWAVENGLRLNATFAEDASPILLRNTALSFPLLRRLATNLFRAVPYRKVSLPRKHRAGTWEPDYLARVLSLKLIRCSAPSTTTVPTPGGSPAMVELWISRWRALRTLVASAWKTSRFLHRWMYFQLLTLNVNLCFQLQ